MSDLYGVAGSKFYIGEKVSLPAGDLTAADFTGVSWTLVDGLVTLGDLGDTQDVGEQSLINRRRVLKYKTTENGGTMENQFIPMPLDAGQIKFDEAVKSCQNYQFKVEYSGDCSPEGDITATIGTPGVITWNNHGLSAGQPVVFANDGGALPGGLTAGTVYYVIAGGLTTNSFSVATTAGGTGVEITDAGTGVTVATAPPVGMTKMFVGLALPGTTSAGDATALVMQNRSVAVNSNIVTV